MRRRPKSNSLWILFQYILWNAAPTPFSFADTFIAHHHVTQSLHHLSLVCLLGFYAHVKMTQ